MKTDLKVVKIEIIYEGGLKRVIGSGRAEAFMEWLRDKCHAKWSDGNHLDNALDRFPLESIYIEGKSRDED